MILTFKVYCVVLCSVVKSRSLQYYVCTTFSTLDTVRISDVYSYTVRNIHTLAAPRVLRAVRILHEFRGGFDSHLHGPQAVVKGDLGREFSGVLVPLDLVQQMIPFDRCAAVVIASVGWYFALDRVNFTSIATIKDLPMNGRRWRRNAPIAPQLVAGSNELKHLVFWKIGLQSPLL